MIKEQNVSYSFLKQDSFEMLKIHSVNQSE